MHHLLFLLFPIVLAATRSLTVAIGPAAKPRRQPLLSAEAEYEMLLIVVFCLTGLLGMLMTILQFPEFGAVIAAHNQF